MNFTTTILPSLSNRIELKTQKSEPKEQSEKHLCDQLIRKEISSILSLAVGTKKQDLVVRLNRIKREILRQEDLSAKTVILLFRSMANCTA